jgi:actin-like ATPase involved in cell morphogenesis
MNFLKRVNIAIDLGTANTLIFREGAGGCTELAIGDRLSQR